MLLCDRTLRNLCTNALFYGDDGPLVAPFSEPVEGENVISYGLQSAGYDLRLAGEILIFKASFGEAIDAKRFKDEEYVNRMFDRVTKPAGTSVVIPANSFALARTLEYIRIPKNLKGRVVGKSTLARCGIIVNVTPLEPEWKGFLTVGVVNTAPCPNTLHVGEGLCQLELEALDDTPLVTYAQKRANRGGKYMSQGPEPVTAKVE